MAREEIINIKVKTGNSEKDVKKVNKALKETKETSKETKGSLEGITGVLDGVTGGAVSKFKSMTGAIKGVNMGFKSMRLAIIGTGIGALVIAVTSLIAAFKSSEEGQNKWNKIMGVVGALTGNIVDLFADLGDMIIWAFEHPKEALNNFIKLIKENIINRFNGLLELIPNLGKAISELFSGNFKEAGKIALNSVAKVVSGVDDLTGKIKAATEATKEFIKEQINEANAAAKVADMRAKADKIERDLIVRRSELESKIAQLRLKSRQEDQFSAEERKQALLDAQKLEDELLDKETEFLTLRRDATILENTFSRTNKENLTKEAEAVAAVNRQVAARANVARQLQRELNTIQGQIDSEQNAIQAAEIARIKELDTLKKSIRDATALEEDQKRDLEIQKVLEHYDALIVAAQAQGMDTFDLEFAQLKATQDLRAKFDAEDTKRADEKRNQDLAREKALQQQKVAIVGQTFGAIAGILGENSKAGKAAAIAQATINTYQGITEVLTNKTTLPEPFGTLQKIASVGTVLATGLTAVRSITAQKLPSIRGGRGGGSGVSAAATPTIQKPNFNIVGKSETNQLASAIGAKENQPIKAYVVSKDVSTAQSLDRNIVEGASI